MARERRRRSVRLAACGALGLVLVGCNVALGGGMAVLVGTVGYFAAECYDHLLVRVRDTESGAARCDVSVWVSDGDSRREMFPCYHAALGEGRWTVEVKEPGYQSVSSEVVVREPEGACPRLTRTVELTLRPIQAPSASSVARAR
jgi:hypothetical protein